MPEDKRWSSEKVLAVIGMPWDPTPNVDAEDAARVPNPDAVEAEVVPKDPEVPETIARRMYIRKTDIIKFGETDGCIGCRTTMLGNLFSRTHQSAVRCLRPVYGKLTMVRRGCNGQTTELRRHWFESRSD